MPKPALESDAEIYRSKQSCLWWLTVAPFNPFFFFLAVLILLGMDLASKGSKTIWNATGM